jgi:hypothetical protein
LGWLNKKLAGQADPAEAVINIARFASPDVILPPEIKFNFGQKAMGKSTHLVQHTQEIPMQTSVGQRTPAMCVSTHCGGMRLGGQFEFRRSDQLEPPSIFENYTY